MSPKKIEKIIDRCLLKIIKYKLQEMSTAGGEGYNGKYAFNPNKNASGTSKNYYLKMGWKLVNKKKLNRQGKGIDVKKLF